MATPLQKQTTRKPFYGWKNVFLLFFIYMATTGLVFYALSVIFPVMIKYTGWNRGDASIALSVATLAAGFLIPIGVTILNKIGTRKTIIIGLCITLVNLILLSTMVSQLWQWIVVWGLMVPIGRVLCHRIAVQTTVMFWFNRKRAMAIGIVMTGAPLGGFLAPPIYTWFMNHMGGWRFGWMLSAAVVFIALGLSFFIKSKPADLGQYPDGIDPENAESGRDGKNGASSFTYRSKTEWTLKEVLKTRTIWFVTGANITQAMCLGLIVTHGVLHLTDIDYSGMDAAFILSLIIVSSGIIRFPLGYLADKVEPRWIIFAALILMLIGFVGIWKAPSLTALMFFAPAFGLAYGSVITILPALIGNYYGAEVFASINGFFAPFLTVIGAMVPTVAGYTVENLGSYDNVFLVLSLLLACGVVLSGFLPPPQKKTA